MREHRDRLQAQHTPEAIARRLAAPPETSSVRDFVYGAVDGAVTTFAIVSGVAGAGLSTRLVLILGVANLIGDGFSMAAGNLLGTRADRQLRDRHRRTERDEIHVHPEGEREEIRQIYAAKGFEGDDLERVVAVITSDRERWIETMLAEEHGLARAEPSPWRAGLVTFAAFCAAGAVPLLPFVAAALTDAAPDPYRASALATAAGFFAIGALKGRIVARSAWTTGLETLGVGAVAAALAYAAGAFVERLMPAGA